MTIFEHLAQVPDTRKDINLKHALLDVLFLTYAAILSGANGWKSIEEFGDLQLKWLRQYLPYENGIPRRQCIAKIIRMIDTALLMQALFAWINERRVAAGKSIIALDGKTMRRTWSGDVHKALHVVSAYDTELGLSLYQKASDSKGKEGELAREIIDAMVIENAILTLDSLHCQQTTLAAITERKNDYIIQLKANQPSLLEYVQEAFKAVYYTPKLAEHVEINTGHGRQEKRSVMQITANLPPELKAKWPSIKSIIEVASERSHKGKTSCDSRWYVSSLSVDAKQAAHAIRKHWAIENNLHWVLDVVFREDEISIKDPVGAAHIALFNRTVLSHIKQYVNGRKETISGHRRGAMWSHEHRDKILFG